MSAARAKPSRPEPSRVLTVRQAATCLGVSHDTVGRMIASGKLAAVHVGGAGTGERTHYRIPVSEVERVLAESIADAAAQRTKQRRRA